MFFCPFHCFLSRSRCLRRVSKTVYFLPVFSVSFVSLSLFCFSLSLLGEVDHSFNRSTLCVDSPGEREQQHNNTTTQQHNNATTQQQAHTHHHHSRPFRFSRFVSHSFSSFSRSTVQRCVSIHQFSFIHTSVVLRSIRTSHLEISIVDSLTVVSGLFPSVLSLLLLR